MTRHLRYNMKGLGSLFPNGYALLFFFALIPLIVCGWAARHFRWLAVGVLVMAPVFVIALDHGRWI